MKKDTLVEKYNRYIIGILTPLLAISYILIEIMDNNIMKKVVSSLVFTFIILSVFNLKGTVARIIYILIGLTVVILIGNKDIVNTLMEGALVNLPIVCILILTPLLGISVKVGKYVNSLKVLLGRFRNNVPFFFITYLILAHIFSVILNIGSILINLHLMESSNVRSKRLIANALNRGYTSITIWSPYLGIMALVISQLNIEWFTLVSYTLGFVVISIIAAVIVEIIPIRDEKRRIDKAEKDETLVQEVVVKGNITIKIIELLVLLALSMGLVMLMDKFTKINIVLSISFVSLLFPLLWCTFKGHIKSYKNEVVMHTTKTLPNFQTEFTLFLVAGIFSHVFVQSLYSDKTIDLLNLLFGHSTFLMAIVISSIIIITGVLGLHPAIMLTIFATSIKPEQLGFSSIYFAALILGSSGIANTISPATAVNNLVSNMLEKEIYTVSFKWNWLYALILFITLPIYLIAVGV